jgi:hypothetical protein
VRAGLWEISDTGWTIHDYLQYQPSRATREAGREAAKSRVSEYRKRKCNAVTGALQEKTKRECNAVTGPFVTRVKQICNAAPDPDPDPDPEEIPPVVPPLPTVDPSEADARRQTRRTAVDTDRLDPDRETPIPLDFKTRFPSSAIEELAEGYKVPKSAIEAELHEFATYWSIGAGAGKRRRNWAAQFRRRVQTRAQAGELGAVASPKDPANPAKTQPRDLYRQPPAKDWQKWVCAMRADETWEEYLVRFAKHQETYVVK